MADDGCRWKFLLVNVLLEDDSKGIGSFERRSGLEWSEIE